MKTEGETFSHLEMAILEILKQISVIFLGYLMIFLIGIYQKHSLRIETLSLIPFESFTYSSL